MSTATAVLPHARRPARWALILALLGLPGSTVAWDLPAGGFWIGMPLAVAAVVIGVRCLSNADRRGRWMAIAAVAHLSVSSVRPPLPILNKWCNKAAEKASRAPGESVSGTDGALIVA